jgi:uncharacterized protein (TIGR00730 family)
MPPTRDQNDGEQKEHPLSKEEIQREIKARVSRIDKEFTEAFEFIGRFPRSVTFFGSSRFTGESEHYIKARALAGKIVKELGYTVLTGGSAGIMEAANRGAFEVGGESVGLNIRLPRHQESNRYTTASVEFDYFFVRKVALSFAAETYLFFPGGFGTLDEFFELITLIQTHKIRRVPIFLVGRDFWEPLNEFIRENMLTLHHAVDEKDIDLYKITDSDEEVIAAIRAVPVHPLYHHHHTTKPAD